MKARVRGKEGRRKEGEGMLHWLWDGSPWGHMRATFKMGNVRATFNMENVIPSETARCWSVMTRCCSDPSHAISFFCVREPSGNRVDLDRIAASTCSGVCNFRTVPVSRTRHADKMYTFSFCFLRIPFCSIAIAQNVFPVLPATVAEKAITQLEYSKPRIVRKIIRVVCKKIRPRTRKTVGFSTLRGFALF